jgi:UPF0755 protein
LAKIVILLGALALLCGVIALGFLLILSGGNPIAYIRAEWMQFELSMRQDDLEKAAGIDSTEKLFLIEAGDTPISIGQHLLSEQFILDSELFVNYMIVEGLDTQVQEGAFFLRQTMTIPQIASQITNRQNAGIAFTVFAGTRIEEIAAAVDNTPRIQFTGQDFLAEVGAGAQIDAALSEQLSVPIGASLEGFMFPGTYILSVNSSAPSFRDMMLAAFQDQVATQYSAAAQQQGYTIRDIVNLASIIEREALQDDEMPLISSVYRNRLNINMKLDADPTVQYGFNGSRGSWWPQITQADYQAPSPYNTYLNFGLPPGPIANPGINAIRAALYPAESAYLYFRARCDGSGYHTFATTYEEHLNNGC